MAPFSRLFASLLPALLPVIGFGQLNGSYTVGSGGNYTTLAAAITALQTNGVSGPVFMNILSGTYTGTWTVNAIPGTSATNRVVFRSQALDSMAVTLSTPGNGPVISMDACSYVSFERITAQALVYAGRITNGASDCGFRNCRLFATSTSFSYAVSSNNMAITRPFVHNNVLTATSRGVAFNAPVGSEIIDADVRNNVVTMATGSGIALNQFNGAHVEGNRITSTGTSITAYIDGISLDAGTGVVRVLRNDITWGIGSAGIRLESVVPLLADPPLVANNMIRKTGGGAAGTDITVTGSDNVILRHNSAWAAAAFRCVSLTNSDNLVIEGNVFQANTGACLNTQTSTWSIIDRNVYYSTTGTPILIPPVTNYTLAAWQALGRDLNSVYADPLFVSTTDLHLQATSPAISFGALPTPLSVDFDGAVRSQPLGTRPDAGADERPEGCTGFTGTYTIGPAVGNNFASFGAAIMAMANCGLTGPVTFLVQSGTYAEQVRLPAITGNSVTNTITFRSQALDSAAVLVQWPSSTTSTNDWVLRMDGADHVTVDRITFERTGTSTYGSVVNFNSTVGTPGSQHTRLTNCRLISGTGSFAVLLGSAPNGDEDSVVVHRTRFQGGSSGLQWNATTDNDRLRASENIFVGQGFQAISMSVRDRGFVVRDNVITITAATGVGITIGNSTAGFDVYRNRVTSNYHACYFPGGVNTSLGGDPRLYNNTFRAAQFGLLVLGGTGGINGLRIDNNSIYGGLNAVSFSTGTTAVASFRNNALVSPAVVLNRAVNTVSMAVASHNALLRTTAGPIAYWTANQNTMAALQSASGQFASSIVANPLFFDQVNGDLHAYAMELDAAGTPITYVTGDVDGQARSGTTPDIGADEFQPQLWAEALNTCSAADAITSTGSGTDQWIYKDRKVVARFNDNGQLLGTVQLNVFLNSGPVRTSDMGQHYLDRNWHVVTQNTITSSASLRLFFSVAEFIPFAVADPLVTVLSDAGVAHYAGTNENCLETDNPGGQAWTGMYPVTAGTEARITAAGGTRYVTAGISSDGELYVTGQGQVLPVELITFRVERINDQEVRLDWSTATEHNNAGFEVWRMIDGEDGFTEVGWVDGMGNSQQVVDYVFTDQNRTSEMSYYQLRQVDKDGSAEYSPVVAVSGSQSPITWSLAPNPAHDRFEVQGAPDGVQSVSLLDGAGRLLRQWTTPAELGLSGVLPGVYIVQVEQGSGEVEQRRLVVQ